MTADKKYLESHQSDDQFGFRRLRRTDDVFIILETVINKLIEFNMPLWMGSIDLRKTFDHIEFRPLFNALRLQGLSEDYVALLSELCCQQ